MKSTTLFMLGGIALLLSTLLFGIQDVLYFLSGEQPQTTFGLWVGIVGSGLRVLGVGALFARQAQRIGVLGLIGLVLLVWGSMVAVGFQAVQLGVAARAVTLAQLAQVPSYDVGNTLLIAFLVAGEILFGVSIFLTSVYPKYAGVLLVVVGMLHYLTGPLAFTRPFYALVSVVAYAWLGLLLVMGNREVVELHTVS